VQENTKTESTYNSLFSSTKPFISDKLFRSAIVVSWTDVFHLHWCSNAINFILRHDVFVEHCIVA